MRQKALALLSDFSYIGRPLKIIKRRRGLGGQFGTLRDVFWHKEEPWGVVQLPSGKRTAVPLSWTDVPTKAVPVKKKLPLVDALRLLEMARFCQPLGSRTKRRRRRKAPQAK